MGVELYVEVSGTDGGGTGLAGEEPRKVLGLYAFMSRMRLPKSYLGKVVLVGLLGTHVPSATLALYVVLASPGALMGHPGTLAALMASILLGFCATLWALRSLLAPLRLTSSALEDYIDSGTLPDLPVGFRDEAGRLMADVRYAVERMDATVRSLEGISGTDHLTGLPNRRRAEERLAEEAARYPVAAVCIRSGWWTSTVSSGKTIPMATRQASPACATSPW